MSLTINTRKFKRIVRDNLLKVLGRINDGQSPQVLVLQEKLVPYFNELCTFSQLIESSAASQIVVTDSNCQTIIEEILEDGPCLLYTSRCV